MKFLLLFTLSSALCYGQSNTFIDTNAVKELGKTFERIKNVTQRMVELEVDTPQADRNPNDFYSEDTGVFIGKPFARELSLEEKLLLYASECWKDSTPPIGLMVYGKHYEYIHRKYIHREPTFEGFIEYLKRK